MKTVSILLILLALFAAGCGSGSETEPQGDPVSKLTPPQPSGVADDERPPSPPKLQ